MDYITLYHLYSFVMINNTCSMISMDIIARNHRHIRILAQTSFGQRPNRTAEKFKPRFLRSHLWLSILPLPAGQRWWRIWAIYQSDPIGLGKGRASRISDIGFYIQFHINILCKGRQSPNTWMIHDDLYSDSTQPSKYGQNWLRNLHFWFIQHPSQHPWQQTMGHDLHPGMITISLP